MSRTLCVNTTLTCAATPGSERGAAEVNSGGAPFGIASISSRPTSFPLAGMFNASSRAIVLPMSALFVGDDPSPYFGMVVDTEAQLRTTVFALAGQKDGRMRGV